MIRHFEIGDKPRPVKFGFNTYAEFERLSGKSLINLSAGEVLTVEQLLLLVFCALREGARKTGEPFDYTKEDVGDWFDENPNVLTDITAFFVESQGEAKPDNKKKPVKIQNRKSR
jgi:hypothetical protein